MIRAASSGIAVAGIGNFANHAIPRIAPSRFARLVGLVSGDRAKGERYAHDQAARLFAGAMPVRAAAQKFSPQDPRFAAAEDTIVFTLEFPGGILATGSASWSYRLQNRLRVGLENAWLDLEPASPAVGQVLRIAGHGEPAGREHPLAQLEQLPLMFDHCADVVLNGAVPLIPASEGLLDMQIIDAIYRAAESGRVTEFGEGSGYGAAAGVCGR